MLRDRFVCGLLDAHIQQRLFVEHDLSFMTARDLALRSERMVTCRMPSPFLGVRKRTPPGRDSLFSASGGATLLHTRRRLPVCTPPLATSVASQFTPRKLVSRRKENGPSHKRCTATLSGLSYDRRARTTSTASQSSPLKRASSLRTPVLNCSGRIPCF